MIDRRKPRAERVRELLASLPSDSGIMLATALDTTEIPVTMAATTTTIEIIEDGAVMHGTTWTTPEQYQDADDADGLLPSLKGATPPTLPTLGSEG